MPHTSELYYKVFTIPRNVQSGDARVIIRGVSLSRLSVSPVWAANLAASSNTMTMSQAFDFLVLASARNEGDPTPITYNISLSFHDERNVDLKSFSRPPAIMTTPLKNPIGDKYSRSCDLKSSFRDLSASVYLHTILMDIWRWQRFLESLGVEYRPMRNYPSKMTTLKCSSDIVLSSI